MGNEAQPSGRTSHSPSVVATDGRVLAASRAPAAMAERIVDLRTSTMPAPGDSLDVRRAKRFVFCAGMFMEGCPETIGGMAWDCPECTAAFLRACERAARGEDV